LVEDIGGTAALVYRAVSRHLSIAEVRDAASSMRSPKKIDYMCSKVRMRNPVERLQA
jgi:hypothetical protein